MATGKRFKRHTESLKPYTSQHSTSNSRIGYLSLLAILLVCSPVAYTFRLESHARILWRPTNRIVYGSTAIFDIYMSVVSPCDSLTQRIEIDYQEEASLRVHLNTTVNEQGKVTQSYPSPINPMVQKMEGRCQRAFMDRWRESVGRVIHKCQLKANSVLEQWKKEQENLATKFKRGWASSLATGLAGGFAGFVVTDLVTVTWHYLSPDSDHNRLSGVELRISEIVEQHEAELNAFKNASDTILQSASLLATEVHKT